MDWTAAEGESTGCGLFDFEVGGGGNMALRNAMRRPGGVEGVGVGLVI